MRKRIVILLALAMATLTSATAQYQYPGKLGGQKAGTQVTTYTVIPPTQPNLLSCRLEITWQDAAGVHAQTQPCHCMNSSTATVPAAALAAPGGFKVAKRCFWWSKHGTVWKLTNQLQFN